MKNKNPSATGRSPIFSDRLRLPMAVLGVIFSAGATYVIWPVDRGFAVAMVALTIAFVLYAGWIIADNRKQG